MREYINSLFSISPMFHGTDLSSQLNTLLQVFDVEFINLEVNTSLLKCIWFLIDDLFPFSI